jgi:hypothetical protein
VLGLVISVLCCDSCAGIVLPYIVLFMDKVVPYGFCDKLNIVNIWTGRANSEIWWISCIYSIFLCFIYCLFLNRIMKWKVSEYVYGKNDKNNNA